MCNRHFPRYIYIHFSLVSLDEWTRSGYKIGCKVTLMPVDPLNKTQVSDEKTFPEEKQVFSRVHCKIYTVITIRFLLNH